MLLGLGLSLPFSRAGRGASASLGYGYSIFRPAENVDPDLATVIADNWQKVLGVLVCMLITIWVIEEFRSAEKRQLGDASDKFIAIQESFAKLSSETSDEKKKEELENTDLSPLAIERLRSQEYLAGDFSGCVFTGKAQRGPAE